MRHRSNNLPALQGISAVRGGGQLWRGPAEPAGSWCRATGGLAVSQIEPRNGEPTRDHALVRDLADGTSCEVYLPRFDERRPPEPAVGSTPDRATNAKTTILLVEDNAAILQLSKLMLESCDYRVLSAADAGEAMEAADGSDIDLLLTDVGLPGMNGFELAGLLLSGRPRMKVLFVSGFPCAPEVNDGLEGRVAFLAKPFGMQSLVCGAAKVLAGAVGNLVREPA